MKVFATAYSEYFYVNYISEVFRITRASVCKFVTEERLRAVELSSSSSSSHRRHIKEMKRAELMWQCSTNENTNEFRTYIGRKLWSTVN